MLDRALSLPEPGDETFFLWGPRQVGKSTLLKATYPEARLLDLLKADEYRRYLHRPEALREELAGSSEPVTFVVVDEVQKVPALLDEIHWLHENRGVRFALCGSSARKVRRGGANLLGGRAVRLRLHGLVSVELGEGLDLDRLLNHGTLPAIHRSSRPRRLLDAYVGDYLKEEVAAEGLSRNLPAFAEFLHVAALSDTQLVSFAALGRECGVSSHTARSWFEVLDDTLLGTWLPAWRRRPKRRTIGAPKWYFADVGVVNHLARRGWMESGSELYGKAFESWIHHELRAFIDYRERYDELSYWRLAGGTEVDFVVGDMRVAIEAKAKGRVGTRALRGLRALQADHPEVERRLVVSLEPVRRRTEDGIEILPWRAFAAELWGGGLL